MRSWCASKGAIQHFCLWCSPHNLIRFKTEGDEQINQRIVDNNSTWTNKSIRYVEFCIACRLSNHAQYRLSVCMEIEWNILFYQNPLNRKANVVFATACCWFVNWLLFVLLIPCPGIDQVNKLCACIWSVKLSILLETILFSSFISYDCFFRFASR